MSCAFHQLDELRAVAPQPLQQVDESRIAGPQVVRRAELCDDPHGFVVPALAEHTSRGGFGQDQDEDVAIFLGQPAEGEDLLGRLVPDQHVPAAAGDIGGLREVLDDPPDGAGHGLAREGAAIGLRVRARRWACSALLRRRARARASTVVTDGLTERPCSRRMYQSTPMPASSATSSRRRPGVRRRRPAARPAERGVSLSRRERRKSPSSLRLRSVMLLRSSGRDSRSQDNTRPECRSEDRR